MFLPIPSLNGKYEIDKGGNVRNSKTKKLKVMKAGSTSYHLKIDKRSFWRCRTALLAEVFGNGSYLPIHSLDCKYEINNHGTVRNAKTKKILKTSKSSYHNIPVINVKNINGSSIKISIQQLMWEVHGVLPTKFSAVPAAIPVQIQKDGEHYTFESMGKCAFFLSSRLHYSYKWLKELLHRRREEIYGWKVFYREPEKRIFRQVRTINGDKNLKS